MWVRDIGSPFSFGAFRQVDTIWGQNGPDRFDISSAERGLRSNFWDHSEIFWSTGFGVIDPNRLIFREKLLLMGRKLFLNNSAISKLKEILTSSLWYLKE